MKRVDDYPWEPSAYAYSIGRRDAIAGQHSCPFKHPHNRAAWHDGWGSARAAH